MAKLAKGKILVSTTGTRILPYQKGQSKLIEYTTSVRNYPRKNRIPVTGFIVPGVCGDEFITHHHNWDFLQEQFPEYNILKVPETPAEEIKEDFSLNEDIELREVQNQIVNGILEKENAKSWFVYLSQGLGKTLLSVYLIGHFHTKTLIMCYKRSILNQWMITMQKKTTIHPDRILLIGTGELLRQIEFEGYPVEQYDVFLCTPGLLTRYAKEVGYEHLNVLMETMGIGLKIFDEAHRNITNMIKLNAYTSVRHTLYLSGDYAQSNRVKQELFYRMFHDTPVIRPTEELMNSLKYTVAVVVKFNSHPSELEKLSIYTRRGVSFFEYMKYEMRKSSFFHCLKFVIDGIIRTDTVGYKILILVNMIDHVNLLTEMLDEIYHEKYTVCRYHGEMSEEEREHCLQHGTMIVSIYQCFSTGIDMETFSDGLDKSLIRYVISGSLCTKIDDNQSGGRARPLPDGSDAFYFMLADFGFDYTKDKLPKRLSYLRETKIKDIRYLEAPDEN